MSSTAASFHQSPYRCIKHSSYFGVYDRLFAPFVGRPITFVEVGVLDGGSLFMWRHFLGPQARVIGVDLNPGARRWTQHGFEIHIGNQADPAFWASFFAAVGPVDVLLDDGGHTFEQQIVTVEQALPHVRDGGLLVVEDTHTSYMRSFNGPSGRSFLSYAKNVVDGINYRFTRFADRRPHEARVYSVRFFESIVAFEVDPPRCVVPTLLDNGGERSDARDFRHADSVVGAEHGRQRFKAFRRLVRFFTTARRNAALGRHFRY